MYRIRTLTVAAIVLVTGLLSAPTAHAGPILDWFGLGDNPPSSYSPLRYWAPNVARADDCIRGPKLSVYPPDRHPEITPTHAVIRYQGAVAAPAETMYQVPTPPATSGAR